MRKFGLIPIEFWKNRDLLALSAQTFKVAVYLVAGPHSNALGCFEIPIPYIADDLKLLRKTVVKAIAQLESVSFLRYDPSTRYALIPSLRASGALQNPNNLISATREISQMPDAVPWKSELSAQIAEIKGRVTNAVTGASITPNERQPHNGDGDGDLNRDRDFNRDGNARGAKSPASPASPVSFSSLSPLPKSFSFPLKDGSTFTIDPVYVDRLEQQFPFIPVRARLQKHLQWFIDNPRKRMAKEGTTKKLLEWLGEANAEMKGSPTVRAV
jgi:hypothetical protein